MITKVNVNVRGEKLVISIPVDVIQNLLVGKTEGKAEIEVITDVPTPEINPVVAPVPQDGNITPEASGDNQVVSPQVPEGNTPL